MEKTKKINHVLLLDENDAYSLLVITDEDGFTLIDTGMPYQYDLLKTKLGEINIEVRDIKRIVITHAHIDHVGTIIPIMTESPNVEIWIHEDDEKILYEELPDLPKLLQDREAVKTLKDQDELPIWGGLTVLNTPGHTPGHICLYNKNETTLIAGDQLNIKDGELVGPDSYYTPDMEQAMESMKKLVDLEIDQVYCYHGGLYKENPMSVIKSLMK